MSFAWSRIRVLTLPELWLYFFIALNLHFSLQTFFQHSVLSILIWSPVAALLLLLSFLRLPKLLRGAPQVVVWLVVLAVIVWKSGYYPERDNDGISFWMPKARALQLWAYLPRVGIADPRFTISHDYPLGMVSLSAFVHSFVDFFDIRFHRLSMLFQSIILWWAFFQRAYELGLSRFWSNFLMLLLVGLQPAIWSHGYLDAPWALAAVLGLSYLLIEKKAWTALPYLIYAQFAKVEAQIILVGVIAGIVILERRWRWMALSLPALLWVVATKYFGFAASREVAHPLAFWLVLGEIWRNTVPLLKFQTLYGATSIALYLALRGFIRLRWRWIWIPGAAVAVYIANYMFSTFNLEWNVKFSWARIILFPCFFIIFMSYFQDSDRAQE